MLVRLGFFVTLWVALLLHIPMTVATTNLTQCLLDVAAGDYGPSPGAIDEHGHTIPIVNSTTNSSVAGLSYRACVEHCGAGPDAFSWNNFSTSFNAWLLPALALISQLPFGAHKPLDNVISALLAIGSPTLAGYTLTFTVLNGQYLSTRFSAMKIRYPNAGRAFDIMMRLQQAPVRVNEHVLPFLVVLPDNDQWWGTLCSELIPVRSLRWSMYALSNIGWFLVAYLFTVIDAFTTLSSSPDPTAQLGVSDGVAVGSAWLWLLAVVFGWLYLSPMSDHHRIRTAINDTNQQFYIVNGSGTPTRAEGLPCKAINFLVDRDPDGDNADGARDDEMATAPIFNYARFLPWTCNVEKIMRAFHNASLHAQHLERVD